VTNTVRRLVVVGGALAGHRSAVHARRLDPDLDITVLAAENELPYQRPPLSKGYLLGSVSTQRVRLRGAGEGYRFLAAKPAVGLDLAQSQVLARDDAYPFDLLIVATGALPQQLEGLPTSERVLYLRTIEESNRLKEALTQIDHLTIIGGGFIGAEVAVSARHMGVGVTIVEKSSHLLSRAVGPGASQLIEDNLLGTGIRLALECTTTIENVNNKLLVSDGSHEWLTDLVVVGVGVVPSTEWLSGALPLREDRGIAVNEFGLVDGYSQIGAAGDVASWHHPLYGRPLRFEHFEVAANQALHTAEALVDHKHIAYKDLPFGWSDQGGLLIQILGVPSPDLIEEEESVKGGHMFLYRRNDRIEGAILVNAADELTTLRDRILSSLIS
jgi:NADPH-dependent 2,4-dienoyl-CoA reductase/sulfur reductase-like enzyme